MPTDTLTFKKVTLSTQEGGYTFTATDFIADGDLVPYIVDRSSKGWTILAVDPDDRPADADRTYTPPVFN